MKIKCNKFKYLAQDLVQHISKCSLNKSANSFNSLNCNLCRPGDLNSSNMAKPSPSVFILL